MSSTRGEAWVVWSVLGVSLVALAPAGGAPVDLVDTRAPGQMVYGVEVYPITFDHGLHAEVADCEVCHAGVGESIAAAESFWPEMSVCGSCHPEAEDTQTAGACATCHPGYRPVWPEGEGFLAVRDPAFPLVRPEPAVRPERALIFSHADHAEVVCGACHDPAVRGGAALPLEQVCLDCHRSEGATTYCATCHPTEPSGRLVTRVAGTRRGPDRVLRPRDHDRDFAVSHGLVAALDGGAACAQCHSSADCATCHEGALGLDSPHAPGFTFEHALAARRDATACASCHSPSGFCVDCHIDAGVVAGEVGRPPLGAVLHPPGWLEAGGGLHAVEAQRDLLECASCHAENDCAQCHAFVNPHGSGFMGRCRLLLEANPRVCADCHGDPDRLQVLCR